MTPHPNMRTEWEPEQVSAKDWRFEIARVGAEALPREGCVIVHLGRGGVTFVASRFYDLADYESGPRMLDIVCAQQTRHLNASEDNVYVVRRYSDGVAVYTGRHSILVESFKSSEVAPA